jgi:organic hydroperoxide reductase OsmC/OhrA
VIGSSYSSWLILGYAFKFSACFMGYLGYVYMESKSFEIRSDVRGGVRLEERSKGLSRSVIMAWPTIFWLFVA